MINLKESLILEEKLKNYIKNGYLDINSFDNPDDEAACTLTELSYLNKGLCEEYSRLIIESEVVGDDYLKSRCLDHLLDLNKKYALKYIEEQVNNMSIPILSTAMSGLVQYSNSKFRKKYHLN
ncbi:hypothetical protein [Proteus alimentorum]|nr:hypothetical protein [Proteus alimentorum]